MWRPLFLGNTTESTGQERAMTARRAAAVAVAILACILPHAVPYSFVPAPLTNSPGLLAASAVSGSAGRGASGCVRLGASRGARAGRHALSPQLRAAPLRPRVADSALRMVNVELLQSIDETELRKMKVAELKEICGACGLSKTGKKADLVARVLELQAAALPPDAEGSGGSMPHGAEDTDTGLVFEEELIGPDEMYNLANPAPARLFNADGTPILREELPELADGTRRFVAQPRTGNCWHGIYFDIQSKGSPLTVTSIRTASSPEGSAPIREDHMDLFVYTCDGSAQGKELMPEAWTMQGELRTTQLPVVSYGESEPFYGAVPLNVPLKVDAGGTIGVCIFASSWRGVVLRAKLGETSGWQVRETRHAQSTLSGCNLRRVVLNP